jgi:hypothetical protein
MPGKIKCPAKGMRKIACGTIYLSISLIAFALDFI